MAIRCFSYSIFILNKKAKFLNETLFSFIIIYSAFWDYFASIPCWFIIYRICLLHSGIMLPRFHAPYFAFWNFVASILCSLFIYATYILHSGICSLDFKFIVCIVYLAFLLSTFCILYSVMMSARFYDRYLHSTCGDCGIPRKLLLWYFHRVSTR